MTVIFIRLFFVIASAAVGYQVGFLVKGPGSSWPFLSACLGAMISFVIIIFEIVTRRISVKGLSSAVFGLILGLIMAKLLINLFELIPIDEITKNSVSMVVTLIFIYLGMVIAMRGKDEFNLVIPYVKLTRQNEKEEFILLDTSVIIDGRIADICKSKFIEGKLIMPHFILRELQQIADSPDALKRNRGRRGLDVLNKMQKISGINIKIHDQDYADIEEVDAKLVKMAKILDAKILTNDYNLNKIAELQGVTVLNINELANALKPVVLPGETMSIKITKEGKEQNQGVGYLDDGTMIVVDYARQLMGKKVDVVVSSVLQTAAGKMIFAKLAQNRNHRQ